MTTVGSFDAKTHLPELLKRAAKGETIQITRRGVPVAKLVPADAIQNIDRKKVVGEIRKFSKGIRLGKLTLRELIEEGRRY